jgi:[NiFe] hydrogenase diaphorase moiety small subunit
MNTAINIHLNGKDVSAQPGQTIMQAADAAGVYIPRLCAHKDLVPFGACRICTVLVNGRPQSACTHPVAAGMVVVSESPELTAQRTQLVEMLFVEGNHFCMFCEKSGHCELQALGYRFGIHAPRYPYLSPQRPVDATHPDVLLDANRCILCGRCVRASRDLDGKHVFHFLGRGPHRRIGVNAARGLGGTGLASPDRAVELCPVGAILRKRGAFRVPVGERPYDRAPIGSDIEGRSATPAEK